MLDVELLGQQARAAAAIELEPGRRRAHQMYIRAARGRDGGDFGRSDRDHQAPLADEGEAEKPVLRRDVERAAHHLEPQAIEGGRVVGLGAHGLRQPGAELCHDPRRHIHRPKGGQIEFTLVRHACRPLHWPSRWGQASALASQAARLFRSVAAMQHGGRSLMDRPSHAARNSPPLPAGPGRRSRARNIPNRAPPGRAAWPGHGRGSPHRSRRAGHGGPHAAPR